MQQEQLTSTQRLARWYRRHREAIIAWSFLIPMLIYFVVMTYVPLAFLIGISFTQWNIITPPQWVGLQNFTFIFKCVNTSVNCAVY